MGEKQPWWTAQMPEVARRLRAHLQQRLPSMRADHDDLLNESLFGLTAWIRRHEDDQRVWVDEPESDQERDAFFRLARVILERRLVDRFRVEAREWRGRVKEHEEALARAPSGDPSIERRVLLRRMLEITVEALFTLAPEDRDLIAITATSGNSAALTPRERQRLRRVRRRIAEAIKNELGTPAADLLSSDM